MAIDFLAMMNEQNKEQEEVSKRQKEAKGKVKQEEEKKPEKGTKSVPKKDAKEIKNETFTYPFSIYTEGKTVDISAYGFEDDKAYTPKEICDIMLKHRHYEFAGEITFKMFEDDNMLVATAKQYKKG